MTGGRLVAVLALGVLVLVPVLPLGVAKEYVWHVIIQIYFWSFIGGAWAPTPRCSCGTSSA